MHLMILPLQMNVVYFIIITFKEEVSHAGNMSKERSQ
jgi:hypothetical protein